MGQGFAIVLAHVGALQSLRSLRRRLTRALGLMSETFNPLNEEQLLASQQKVVHAAQDLISGSQPFIEGVRKIVALRFYVASSQDDPDFTPFVAVDSETDHLPPESAMAHCTDEWKAQSAGEIQSAILLHGPTIFAACERLIQRFAK